MSVALVSHTTGTGVLSASASVTATAGNCLVVFAQCKVAPGGTPIPALSGGGNVYTPMGFTTSQSDGSIACKMFVATNINAGTYNVTADNDASYGSSTKLQVYQYSGVQTGYPNLWPTVMIPDITGVPHGYLSGSVTGAIVASVLTTAATMNEAGSFTMEDSGTISTLHWYNENALNVVSATSVLFGSTSTSWQLYAVGLLSLPDFTLSGTPTGSGSSTVLPGSPATYTVSTSLIYGYSGTVTWSVISGLPTGATAPFSPTTTTGAGSTTLTVNTNSVTPPGVYTLTVQGTDGTNTHTSTVPLTVLDPGVFSPRWVSV